MDVKYKATLTPLQEGLSRSVDFSTWLGKYGGLVGTLDVVGSSGDYRDQEAYRVAAEPLLAAALAAASAPPGAAVAAGVLPLRSYSSNIILGPSLLSALVSASLSHAWTCRLYMAWMINAGWRCLALQLGHYPT